MEFTNFERQKGPTKKQIEDKDIGTYRENAAKGHDFPRKTIGMLNRVLRENGGEANGINGIPDRFSEEEKRERYALSLRLRGIYTEKLEKASFVSVPATNLRFPEQFMMNRGTSPEDIAENQKIADVMKDWHTDSGMYIGLYRKMLSRFETGNIDRLISEPISDQELVDNAEAVIDTGTMILQFQNFREAILQSGYQPQNDEERRMLDECNAIMNRFESRSDSLTTLTKRLGLIENPYYAVLDVDDPDVIRACTFVKEKLNDDELMAIRTENEGPVPGDEDADEIDELNEADYDNLDTLIYETHTIKMSVYNGEIVEAQRVMTMAGAAPENLFYRMKLNGETVEKPFSRSHALNDLDIAEGTGIELFDRSGNAKMSLEVTKDLIGRIQKAVVCDEDVLPQRILEPRKPDFTKPAPLPKNPTAEQEERYAEANSKYLDELAYAAEYPTLLENYDREKQVEEIRREQYNQKHPNVIRTDDRHYMTVPAVQDAKDALDDKAYQQTILDIYGGKRRVRGDYIESAIISEDSYRKMAQNEYDVSALNPGGTPVDELTFASISMTMSLHPDFKPKNPGLPDTIRFEDLVMLGKMPRANTQSALDDCIEPSRKLVYDCLSGFDKEGQEARDQFAEKLAGALNVGAERLADKGWVSAEPFLADTLCKAYDFAVGHGLEDTMKEHGLTENTVKNIRVMREVSGIMKEAAEAKVALLNDNYGDPALTEEERRQRLDSIIIAKTLSAEALANRDKAEEIEEPQRRPGETREEFRLRTAEWAMKMTQMFMDKDKGDKKFAPMIEDHINGGDELKDFSYRLYPEEKRQQMVRGDDFSGVKSLLTETYDTRTLRDNYLKSDRYIADSPEKALDKLIKPENPAAFSEDPEIRRVQQVVLYYHLSGRDEFAKGSETKAGNRERREMSYSQYSNRILTGNDELSETLIRQPEEKRNEMLVRLAGGDKNIAGIADMEKIAGITNLEKAEKIADSLFAPKPAHVDFDVRANPEERKAIMDAQALTESLELPVPEGLDEDAVKACVMGLFLRDNVQKKIYDRSVEKLDKERVFDSTSLTQWRSNFYINTLAGEVRPNVNYCREYVPEVRKEAAEILREYANGNKTRFAEAIRDCMKYNLEVSKGHIDKVDYQTRMTDRMIGQCQKLLDRPDLKDAAGMSGDLRKWCDLRESEKKLIDEADNIRKELSATANERILEEQSPMSDPAVREKITRYLAISQHFVDSAAQVGDYRRVNASGYNVQISDGDLLAQRQMTESEKALVKDPDAYMRKLSAEVGNTEAFEELEKIKGWGSLCSRLTFSVTPITRKSATLLAEHENHMMPQLLKEDLLDRLPENEDYRELIRRIGNLPCMKSGDFPEIPTDAQITERAEAYRELEKFVGKEYPEGLRVPIRTRGFTEKTDIIRDLRRLLTAEADRLENSRDLIAGKRAERALGSADAILAELDGRKGTKYEYSFSDEKGNPIPEEDVKNRIAAGETLKAEVFRKGEFTGMERTFRYDPQTDRLSAGEKLTASRVAEIGDKIAGKGAAGQLETLEKASQVLSESGNTRFHNSSEFRSMLGSLKTLTEAQKQIGSDPNVRQVAVLQRLYSDFHEKAQNYASKKENELAKGDRQDKLRHDTVKSLLNITEADYVRQASGEWYRQQGELNRQSALSADVMGIIMKQNQQTFKNTETEKMAEFCRDFDRVVDFVNEQRQTGKDMTYIMMGLGHRFDNMVRRREAIGAIAELYDGEEGQIFRLDPEKLSEARSISAECEAASAKYAAMDPEIPFRAQHAPEAKNEISDPAAENRVM